jgi:hypothetical protein
VTAAVTIPALSPAVGALASVMPAAAMVGMPVPASAGAAMMGGLAPGTLVAAPSVGGVAMMAPPAVLLIAAAMMGRAAMSLAAAMTGLGPLAASPAVLPARVRPLPPTVPVLAARRLATLAAAMFPTRAPAIPILMARARVAPAGVSFAPPVLPFVSIGPGRGCQDDQRRPDRQASRDSRSPTIGNHDGSPFVSPAFRRSTLESSPTSQVDFCPFTDVPAMPFPSLQLPQGLANRVSIRALCPQVFGGKRLIKRGRKLAQRLSGKPALNGRNDLGAPNGWSARGRYQPEAPARVVAYGSLAGASGSYHSPPDLSVCDACDNRARTEGIKAILIRFATKLLMAMGYGNSLPRSG